MLAQNPSIVAKERLDIIEKTQDGFVLAEEDLKLRGPGEFFGTRQSGLPDLRMAKLSDIALLELARSEATRLFQTDPSLEKDEHHKLAKELGNPRLVNTILMGVLSHHLPFELSLWQETMKNKIKAKLVDINLKAFDRGREIKLESVKA